MSPVNSFRSQQPPSSCYRVVCLQKSNARFSTNKHDRVIGHIRSNFFRLDSLIFEDSIIRSKNCQSQDHHNTVRFFFVSPFNEFKQRLTVQKLSKKELWDLHTASHPNIFIFVLSFNKVLLVGTQIHMFKNIIKGE